MLILAPAHVLLAQLEDGIFEFLTPGVLAYPVRPTAALFQPAWALSLVATEPAVEGVPADAEAAAGEATNKASEAVAKAEELAKGCLYESGMMDWGY